MKSRIIIILLACLSYIPLLGVNADEEEKMPNQPASDEKIVYQKYLDDGDLVICTEKVSDAEDKEHKKYQKRDYSLYLKKKDQGDEADKVQIWKETFGIPEQEVTPKEEWDQFTKFTPYDTLEHKGRIYFLYVMWHQLYIVATSEPSDESTKASPIMISKVAAVRGSGMKEGHLFALNDDTHIVISMLNGDQMMWRIDGDTATSIWRIGAEELKRQKEQAQKESTTPDENAKPDNGTTPGGETAPPAEGGTTPPATDGAAPPLLSNTSHAESVTPPAPSAERKASPHPATPEAETKAAPAPAPATGFPWYAAGIIGLILGAAATFALTRKK